MSEIMSEIIYLSDVRLSFPHLVDPQVNKNPETGKERSAYNADFIMPQDHPGFQAFMQRYAVLAQEKWKENAQAAMQRIQADRKTRCFGLGEEKVNSKTFQVYSGYKGMVYLSASRDQRPQVVDASGKPIDSNNTMIYQDMTRKMYAGCRVNAAIKPWLQQNTHGVGVRCDFVAIQFFKDDNPFGEGAPDVTPYFKPVDGVPAPDQAASALPMPPFMAAR